MLLARSSASSAHAQDGGNAQGAWALCIVVGAFALALITLAHPGATRMWAWPWEAALLLCVTLPVAALLLRSIRNASLALPPPLWGSVALATASVLLLSAAVSPHRSASLLWTAVQLSPLATYFVAFDWLHTSPDETTARRERLRWLLLGACGVVAFTSVALWLSHVVGASWATIVAARNPFPLGHSNYTAGVALIGLAPAVFLSVRAHGWARRIAICITLALLTILFTSASRGGFVAAGFLAGAFLFTSQTSRKRKLQLGLMCLAAAVVVAVAHPRTRAWLQPGAGASALATSDIQREAMLVGGWQLGLERPLLGWGAGTTPLVFPRVRGGLEGGAENVLQLHSWPIHVWAELGFAGLLCAMAALVLVVLGVRTDRNAATATAGYLVFSLFDWQLDVPFFGHALAVLMAMLTPAAKPSSRRAGQAIALGFTAALGAVALWGKSDPAPALNVRALSLAQDPAKSDAATGLLRSSLALNPHQEIAHFNLGWLLLVRDPQNSATHFIAAARLVPDKGGVYFGLALALRNGGRTDAAAAALALECVNDPTFLHSLWWREPAVAALREPARAAFARHLARAREVTAARPTLARQIENLASTQPSLGSPPAGPGRAYRRERTGYPVLMRDLDLAPPVDLYDVRELATRPALTGIHGPLPQKGWLPGPVLLTLLEDCFAEKP
jgi:tetratricopeptide (TPR) repeat protein